LPPEVAAKIEERVAAAMPQVAKPVTPSAEPGH